MTYSVKTLMSQDLNPKPREQYVPIWFKGYIHISKVRLKGHWLQTALASPRYQGGGKSSKCKFINKVINVVSSTDIFKKQTFCGLVNINKS